jgi:hypothetical protein
MSPAKRNIIIAGVGLILLNVFVAVMLLLPAGQDAPTNEEVVVGEDLVPGYVVPVAATSTVLSAMVEHASSSDFSFDGKDYPGMGFFVNEIARQASTNDQFWILYINGSTSPVGVSEAQVVPGDIVEWRFEESIY